MLALAAAVGLADDVAAVAGGEDLVAVDAGLDGSVAGLDGAEVIGGGGHGAEGEEGQEGEG